MILKRSKTTVSLPVHRLTDDECTRTEPNFANHSCQELHYIDENLEQFKGESVGKQPCLTVNEAVYSLS